MRSSIVRTLLTISFAALGATTLSAQGPTIHFTTPFDFSVGRNALPAGEYHVVPIGEFALAIRQPNGGNAVFFLTNAAAAAISKPTATTVTFRRYGNRYFLSEMLNRGSRVGGSTVPDGERVGQALRHSCASRNGGQFPLKTALAFLRRHGFKDPCRRNHRL